MPDWSLPLVAVATVFSLAPVVLVALLLVDAPYGRHRREGWGPTLPCRTGWVLMEAPALVVFALTVGATDAARTSACLGLAGLWLGHYGYRTLIYPALLRDPARPMPVAVVLSGATFNVINGYANGAWLGRDAASTPALVAGSLVFLVGFATHVHADAVLRRLRHRGDGTYAVPERGLHRLVASPNYLGEIVQWGGFALASHSPAALAFVLFTIANLLPRSLAHRRWYRATFPAYPTHRRALIPWIL